jgi:UDP-glucose 4-epimerase
VGDIVEGLLRAGYFEAALGQEFNLASGQETRIIDLARMINDQVGNPGGILFAERRKWDTKSRLLASVTRAGQLIGYAPGTPLAAGLGHTVAWFRDNWNAIQAAARFGPGMSSAVRPRSGN